MKFFRQLFAIFRRYIASDGNKILLKNIAQGNAFKTLGRYLVALFAFTAFEMDEN